MDTIIKIAFLVIFFILWIASCLIGNSIFTMARKGGSGFVPIGIGVVIIAAITGVYTWLPDKLGYEVSLFDIAFNSSYIHNLGISLTAVGAFIMLSALATFFKLKKAKVSAKGVGLMMVAGIAILVLGIFIIS